MPKKEPIFFDTDNLACFLWVDNRAILPLLFPGRIFISEEDCEKLWQEMLAAGRWLTAPTYKDYIKNNPCVDFL